MKEIFLAKFNQNVKIINIGEYYATKKNEGIGTILGSCICTCIYDDKGKIGGMNHFLIPGKFQEEEIFLSPIARYGMFAIELLMGELIKLGVDRSNLKAKIFGGADFSQSPHLEIGKNNIQFIKSFLKLENIPIISNDLGGESLRKILFFPISGKVMVKKIHRNMNTITQKEINYHKKVKLEI